MHLLVTEESYGWARRKVTEARISLAAYALEPEKDGNSELIRSLEDVKQALLYLDFGDMGVAQEAMQGDWSNYRKLIGYIDSIIEASNLLQERSVILFNVTSNLVAFAEELIGQAGRIWGLDVQI